MEVKKKNGVVRRIDSGLDDALKQIAQREDRSVMSVTRKFGRQLQNSLRESAAQFQPKFTLPKMDFQRRKKMGKKGGVIDVIFITIVMFVVAIGFVFLSTVWQKVEPRIITMVSADANANASIGYTSVLANSLDNLFLIFFVFMIIAVIILAFQVEFHPIFYFLFIIVLVFGLMLAVIFSNTYEKVIDRAQINSSLFGTQNYIMANLPVMFLIIGVLAILAIYIKVKVST